MQALSGVFAALLLLLSPDPQVPVPGGAQGLRDGKPAPTGTATLSGRVISAETGKPLRRAVVRVLSAELRGGKSVSTEPDGRWQIKDLPAGKYTISATKGGFVPLSYGQRRPFEPGTPIELVNGQVVEKLELALPKGSVVSGRIVDEFGEPVSGAQVTAMRQRFVSGQRRLFPMMEQGGRDTTDDLGQYRLHGLSPGNYYVSAAIGMAMGLEVSADKSGYAGTYYPGTSVVAEAQRLSVAVGQEVTEINFALAPTRVAKITGVATDSHGKPVSNGAVVLTTSGGAVGAGGTPLVGMTMTQPDGSYTLSNIPPGEYRLEMLIASDFQGIAQATNPTLAMSESASIPVTITGQDVTVNLVSVPTSAAIGRVVFDGGAPPAAGTVRIFGLSDMPISMALGGWSMLREDGTFEVKGLTGKRLFRANLPSGWFLKAVRINDVDVIDTPVECKPGENVTGLELHVTQNAPSLSGTVLDPRGKPATDYVVVLFSSDSRKWGYQTRFVRSARPDQSGGFAIKGIAPDDYFVVALDYLEEGEQADPELLERWRSAATAISIGEGAKTVSLKLYSSTR